MTKSMPPQKILFPAQASSRDAALGVLSWTRSQDGDALIFELELISKPDNRLTPEMIDGCIMPALDVVERTWRADLNKELEGGPGSGAAALITSGNQEINRFYSNGLDLQNGPSTVPHWFRDCFHKMLGRLLTFPVATIAAINGHAFAGGLTLALAHDYRILKNASGKGGQAMLSLNEVHFGSAIPPGMCHLTRSKTSPHVFHKIAVEGRRYKGPAALEANLVDDLAATGAEVLVKARALAAQVSNLSKHAAVGLIKEEAYKHTLTELAIDVAFHPSGEKREPFAKARLERRGQAKL